MSAFEISQRVISFGKFTRKWSSLEGESYQLNQPHYFIDPASHALDLDNLLSIEMSA